MLGFISLKGSYLASFYFLFSEGVAGPGRGEGEVPEDGGRQPGQPRPRAQSPGAEGAARARPGQVAQLLRPAPEGGEHCLELQEDRAKHPGVPALAEETQNMKSFQQKVQVQLTY